MLTLRRLVAVICPLALASLLSACATPAPKQAAVVTAPPAVVPSTIAPVPTAPPQAVANAPAVTGLASWYRSDRRLHRTYSGQLLNNNALTAASSVLPMGTMVRVGRIDDSRSVVLRVNDRMPHNRRLIDVSETAARDLGLMGCGVAKVTVTPVVVASSP